MQHQHVQEAAKNPALFAKANGGRPPIAATPKPAAFHAPGVVGAHGAAPAAAHPAAAPVHGNSAVTPPPAAQTHAAHTAPANTGAHPQAVTGKPSAAKPKAQKPNAKTPPEKKKHEPEGDK
jgi:hypothetical protein